MPAVAFILPFAEAFFGGAISAFVGSSLASMGILAEGVIGAIETGAIVGMGEGAVAAALTGQDIGKGALGGLVGGGVGAGVSSALGGALNVGQAGGYSGIPSSTYGSGVGGAVQRGVSALAGGTASGLATGRSFDQALRGSIPGALGGALSGALQYGAGIDPTVSREAGTLASQLAKTQAQQTPTYRLPSLPEPTIRSNEARPSPTLGQSLSIAPSLGYTPGGSVFGSSDTEGKKSNVWNVGSLRNVGSEA